MAEKAKEGKKKNKNKPSSKKYQKYKIQGAALIRDKNCPRCGAGIFLAVTNDRAYCGKCHYTEFLAKAK